ncbi:MAG: helix-turn-helix domain-containing protein [Paraclostridium sp.]
MIKINFKISENLNSYMKKNDLSMRAISRNINVNHNLTRQIIKLNRNNLRIEVVYNIAKTFNVSIDDLLYKNIFQN